MDSTIKPLLDTNRHVLALSRMPLSNLSLGIDDDITRRDSLHAIINSLPDPNYATLRALILVSSSPFNTPSHPHLLNPCQAPLPRTRPFRR